MSVLTLSRLPKEIIHQYASGIPLENENFVGFPTVLEHAIEMRVHTMEVLGENHWLLREEEVFLYEYDEGDDPYHDLLDDVDDMYQDCCISEFIAIVFDPFIKFLSGKNIGELRNYFRGTGNDVVDLAYNLRSARVMQWTRGLLLGSTIQGHLLQHHGVCNTVVELFFWQFFSQLSISRVDSVGKSVAVFAKLYEPNATTVAYEEEDMDWAEYVCEVTFVFLCKSSGLILGSTTTFFRVQFVEFCVEFFKHQSSFNVVVERLGAVPSGWAPTVWNSEVQEKVVWDPECCVWTFEMADLLFAFCMGTHFRLGKDGLHCGLGCDVLLIIGNYLSCVPEWGFGKVLQSIADMKKQRQSIDEAVREHIFKVNNAKGSILEKLNGRDGLGCILSKECERMVRENFGV